MKYVSWFRDKFNRAIDRHVPVELSKVPAYEEQIETRIEALKLANTKGLYLEFGVWEGASINLFAALIKPRRIYGFDSFEGLPEDWQNGFPKGRFSLKGKMPAVVSNVVLVKGLFSKSLPEFAKKHSGERIAFLHMDCDLYSSAKDIFDNLDAFNLDGTVILFDELYGYRGYKQGEYLAFQQFLSRTGMKVDYLGRCKWSGQAIARISK